MWHMRTLGKGLIVGYNSGKGTTLYVLYVLYNTALLCTYVMTIIYRY